MQYKKTEITNTDNLPDLTEQQRNFVHGILAGKSASDAYRAAYDCSNSQPNTIWVEASRLRSSPNVSLWLAEARKAEMGQAKLTLEQHIKRLDSLKEICIANGNLGAAVQAEQLIGKALGLYQDRLEVTTNQTDTEAELRKLLPADIAEQLINEALGTNTKPN